MTKRVMPSPRGSFPAPDGGYRRVRLSHQSLQRQWSQSHSKKVPSLGVIIAYADNILLLAKTKSDRDSMTKALLAAFEAHPVGRLRLSPRTFGPGEPVEFLGHRLTPCEEGVRIEITDANKRKFEDRMKSKLRSLAKTKRQRARRKRRERRDEFRLARSRCGRSQVRVVMRRRRQWRERARPMLNPTRRLPQCWAGLVTPQPGASMAGNVRYWHVTDLGADRLNVS